MRFALSSLGATHQFREDAIPGNEIVVRILLRDSTLLEDKDAVRLVKSAETVRDHDNCVGLARVIDGRANAAFTDVIEGRSSFIENKHRRILQEHSRQCDALTLPAGKIPAPLSQYAVITFRHLENFFVNVRLARCFLDLLEIRRAAAITSVFRDGAGKNKGHLTDVADGFADVFASDKDCVILGRLGLSQPLRILNFARSCGSFVPVTHGRALAEKLLFVFFHVA
jgi:hypothetical protein